MSKSIWIRFAGAAFLAGGLWIASSQQQAEPLKIVQVKENLHVIYGSGGNVAVLTTPAGVVLVDDKFDRNVPEILEKVRSVTSQPIRYVFNTHHHGDHSGGNVQMARSAQLISQENARERMATANYDSAPNLSFTDQQILRLGGMEVRAMYFGRAHTDGDAVIYFPQLRVVHTGDMFVRGAPFIDYSSGGSAVQWDDTLTKVVQLDFDTVIPGHGDVGTREDLNQWRADFATFRTRVQTMARDGKTPDEIASGLDVSDLRGWTMSPLARQALPRLVQELQ